MEHQNIIVSVYFQCFYIQITPNPDKGELQHSTVQTKWVTKARAQNSAFTRQHSRYAQSTAICTTEKPPFELSVNLLHRFNFYVVKELHVTMQTHISTGMHLVGISTQEQFQSDLPRKLWRSYNEGKTFPVQIIPH